MNLVDLYTVNGLVDTSGNYIPASNVKTIIAECVDSRNLDSGCYYYALSSYVNVNSNVQQFPLGFIEITNLASYVTAFSNKINLSDSERDAWQNYIYKASQARDEINKLNIKNIEKIKEDIHGTNNK